MPATPAQWNTISVVNNNVGADASVSQVVQLNNGNTLVAWTSADPTAPTSEAGDDLRGQIFDPLGNEIGGEFRLNVSRTAHDENEPSITALEGGGFAVTYLALEFNPGTPDQFNTDVVVDVFGSTGTFLSGEVLADNASGTVLTATAPVIASVSAANTLTTWYDPSTGDVLSQVYNPTGDVAVGAQNVVFDGATGAGQSIRGVAVTALDNDDYIVVFGSETAGDDSIQFQRVSATTGASIGVPVTVQTVAEAFDPSITTLTDGRFIITYTIDASGGTNSEVRARIYYENGTPSTGVLTFASTTAGNQVGSAVAALPNGESVVFWVDENTSDIHGQRLSATGTTVGAEFDVANLSATALSNISATLMDDGRIQVTWQEQSAFDTISTAYWDPRDTANSPDVNGYQIGTIANDVFDVETGAVNVHGHLGDDRITVDVNEVDPAAVLDGGDGSGDVLVIADTSSGTWDFRGETVTGFEEIEFEALVADFVRNATFADIQLAGVTQFDFGSTASAETLTIFVSSTTPVDYSSVAIAGFEAGLDAIEINGDGDANEITGTSAGDTISGGGGADTLNGGGGDDVLIVELDGAINFYNGGAGVDTLDFSIYGAAISLDLTTIDASGTFVSNGTTTNFTGITNVVGTALGDVLRGSGTVDGGAGNDTLFGNGDNLVLGGAGNDAFAIADSDGTPDFDGGADIDGFNALFLSNVAMYVELGVGYRLGTNVAGAFDGTLTNIENFFGDSNDDFVIGSSVANFIEGNGGNDTINGGDGADTLSGGGGNDLFLNSLGGNTFIGGADFDTVDYSSLTSALVVDMLNPANNGIGAIGDTYSGIEQLIGTTNADFLRGDNNSNTFQGNGGDDTLLGEGGADSFISSAGNESINGGAGADGIDYASVTDDLVFNLGANFFSGSAQAGNDTISGIENLNLGAGNDRAFGSAEANLLFGNAGDDVLSGLDGNDLLSGGTGQDALSGGNGNDTLLGGDNNDRLFGNNNEDVIQGGAGDDLINGGNGNDFVDGGADDDNAVVGGGGNDTVLGGAGADGLNGSFGNDSVDGGSGMDRVFGGQGEDTLVGGTENDTLGGGSENDVLFGGAGNDGMNGNTGNDTMNGDEGNDTLFGSNGDDVINGGADDDLLVGQGGLDTFVFVDNWGNDRISRYGELVQGGPRTFDEVIDMSGTTATSFADLQVTQVGNSTFVNIIGDTENSIEILFQSASGITADDFIFI